LLVFAFRDLDGDINSSFENSAHIFHFTDMNLR
jgi:hypothetical protein